MTDSDTSEISSLLSKSQREWLRGDDDALGSPDRVVRSRIKKRMVQGVSDLAVIFRSDRISSEDVMKSVREETKSSDENAQKLASSGEMNEEMVADALDSAINQLEMTAGKPIEDIHLDDLMSQIRRVKNQHGHLDDETVLTFAVAGAMAGLFGAGKTEKQTRQWIEHHWPGEDEALDEMDKVKKMTMV